MATNLEFIKSASGSSVSSLSVTDCFSADYDVYEIYVTNTDQSTTADTRFSLLDSGGSEITTASYDFAFLLLQANTTFTETKFTNQTNIFSLSYDTSSYSQSAGLKFTIYNPYDSGSYTFLTFSNTYYQNASSGKGNKGIGVLKSAQTCTGIKLFGNTGSFDSIDLSVYGVK